MTQIMNLRLLAPDIQEQILCLPKITSGHKSTTIAQQPDWRKQRKIWEELREQSQEARSMHG
jgi:hypothetical protein